MKKLRENAFMFSALLLMIILGVLLFLPLMEFRDSTYRVAYSFVENDPTEKTIEECISELGEPIYIDEQTAYFSGGCTRRFGYISESKKYDLVVIYDENRYVTEVYHICKLSLRKGLLSIFDLVY